MILSPQVLVVPTAPPVATATTLVESTFTGADGTAVTTADTGHVFAKTGTWVHDLNRAKATAAEVNLCTADAADADVTVQADVTLGPVRANCGLAFRFADPSNTLIAILRKTSTDDKIQLQRGLANSWLILSEVSAVGLVLGQTYQLKVVTAGTLVKIFLNGVEKISATVADHLTATRHGLWSYATATDDDNGARWDNLKVLSA